MIVTFRDTDTHGKAVILDISGSTISAVGSEYEFSGGNTFSTCVTRLSDTKAIVAYITAATGLLTACVLDVSGTTITVNSEQTLTSGDADYVSVCSLDSSTAVFGYRDNSDAALKAAAMTSITTTGTFGSIVTLDNTNLSFDNVPGMPFIRKIDSSRAAICYQTDNGNPFTIRLIIISNSGGVVTFGSSIALSDAGYDEFPTIVVPNEALAVVLFDRAAGGGSDGLYSTATISGTTATYNSDQTAWEGDTVSIFASAMLKTIS